MPLKKDYTTMNLDDFSSFVKLDPQNMLAEIDSLPEQLEKAFGQGLALPLLALPIRQNSEFLENSEFSHVVISGMGGSAIGADLLAAYLAPTCKIPVFVHRDYGLPAFARGPETLVIASSHSGNTEETLDSFEAALKNGCRVLAISTGGGLAKRAEAAKVPLWQFEHKGQPRAAVGFSFGLLLAAFARLGLIGPLEKVTTDPQGVLREVVNTVTAMKKQQETLRAEVPVAQNPAKRMAGQLMERWVNVFGSGLLAPVARRWKGQINELAKAGAGFDALPEADHNTLAGLSNPEDILSRTFVIFLRAASDHPRNRLRAELTRQAFMLEGLNTDFFDAQGDSPLAHIWTALHFGDYTAYYLAMAYGVDPTPVAALEDFKAAMQAAKLSNLQADQPGYQSQEHACGHV
ncbi:MAG: bifunctional phosphoglucose/phosphomannose isomerase [Anaerolineales bacterium]|nr:bifunctional phosphoglucose/phosphomannose isomerase [Anaerolineales bacterium]